MLGHEALRERAAEWTPERTSAVTGLPAATIISLGERYGRARAAFIRVNYGLQRHGGGGMAVRTIACLPAITGHWRRAGGGVQMSTSANFTFDRATLERPDPRPPATPRALWTLAEHLLPRTGSAAYTHNQALMELGALICTARVRHCECCPVRADCRTVARDG